MSLGKQTAITLFVNGKKILTSDSMMQDVYERNKNTDGFLYVQFKEGEHFGWKVNKVLASSLHKMYYFYEQIELHINFLLSYL